MPVLSLYRSWSSQPQDFIEAGLLRVFEKDALQFIQNLRVTVCCTKQRMIECHISGPKVISIS